MQDMEHSVTIDAAAVTRGKAELEIALERASRGQDPFQQQPLPESRSSAVHGADVVEHPDVAEFERFLHRYGSLMLCLAYVFTQAFSWVLMKGALNSMHTPAVLTFLHLLTAAILQLTLASRGFLEQPTISINAAKGAIVHAGISSLQVLLTMAVLSYSSVYMLLCWITVMPLLISFSRAADVTSSKSWMRQIPPQLQLPFAAACCGLVLELLSDQHRGILPVLLLVAWCGTVVLQHLWRQVKADATLGHRIMDPDFLFRARQLSDLEDAVSPSTLTFMSAALPAVPVLVLGLVCLEGRDLVEHEPSVPTLSVLLLSCLAYAAATNLQLLMTSWSSSSSSVHREPQHAGLLLSAAAVVAVVLDFMERAFVLGGFCLLGVVLATGGSLAAHWMQQGHTLQSLQSLQRPGPKDPALHAT